MCADGNVEVIHTVYKSTGGSDAAKRSGAEFFFLVECVAARFLKIEKHSLMLDLECHTISHHTDVCSDATPKR